MMLTYKTITVFHKCGYDESCREVWTTELYDTDVGDRKTESKTELLGFLYAKRGERVFRHLTVNRDLMALGNCEKYKTPLEAIKHGMYLYVVKEYNRPMKKECRKLVDYAMFLSELKVI